MIKAFERTMHYLKNIVAYNLVISFPCEKKKESILSHTIHRLNDLLIIIANRYPNLPSYLNINLSLYKINLIANNYFL
jgi:hypothetical protein